jgi:tagatose-1,6-bisphosphate aldolase
VKSFDLTTLESISKILGDTCSGLTGSEISKFLTEWDISEPGTNSTKWKRLFDSILLKQKNDPCANKIVSFITHVMRPSRHFDNEQWFENKREKLNKVLSFEGLELNQAGY